MKERLRSLRARLVAYVFCIMTLASLITGVTYLAFYRVGWIRPLFITQMMSPIWSVCLSSVLATVFTAWFGKYYLSPITQVIEATKRVAKGDFSVRLPEDSGGEINDLVHSFNAMAHDLGGIEMFRSDFINSFSHEFKTPIVSIRGFARQLQRDDLTDAQRREYAAIIESESERLVHLSSSVLQLSKLENQQIVSEKTAFRLDEQLRTCILLFERQWESKNLSLDVDLQDVTLYSNPDLLSQAWVNLISNAIKFTPEGGAIAVCLAQREGKAVVTISDTGIGMSAETLSHMFEKFYQGDHSHHYSGNGLGLPMVRRIIDLCGGTIQAESELGRGTVFTVTLDVVE